VMKERRNSSMPRLSRFTRVSVRLRQLASWIVGNKPRYTQLPRVLGLILCAVVALIASSGVINVISRNQVSQEIGNGYRWEPSSAVGVTSDGSIKSWATSWLTDDSLGPNSYVSVWTKSSSSWTLPIPLVVNSNPVSDVNVAWDATRNRFVFVAIDSLNSVWYGYFDASGTAVTFTNQALFGAADYPSIAVDPSGNIVVGAVIALGAEIRHETMLSTNGEDFGNLGQVFDLTGGAGGVGGNPRIIAAGYKFQAFSTTLDGGSHPISIQRYESTDGINWGSPIQLMSYGAPLPYAQPSGSSSPIYYAAEEIAAAGSPDGRWIVAWQASISGWNNVQVYTSDVGTFSVNQTADDEFLAGVSANTDGYWVTYHAYPNLESRSLFGNDSTFGLIT
jgi:hypothetical protein